MPALIAALAIACIAQQPPASPPPAAASQEATAPPSQPQMPPERPIEWTFKLPIELGISTGFDNQPGDLTVSRVGAEIGVGIPIGMRGQLTLGFEYERSHYDFQDATGFIAGTSKPFENINQEVIRARYGRQEDAQWSWLVGGSIRSAAEDGADFGKSITGSVLAGFGYNINEHLKVGAAIAIVTQIEDNPLILPVPTLDWQIAPEWRLTNAGKPGLSLFYTPCEQWTISVGGWYESRNFRLDSNGPVPDGVGREHSVPIAIGATFRANRNISLDFSGGVRFFTNYQIDDSDSNTLADIDGDPAPFITIQFSYSF